MTGHSTQPDSLGKVWGQYVRVHRALGWAKELFRSGSKTVFDTAVLVLWDYDAGCEVTRYGGPLPLGLPGDTVVIRGRLRDREEWVDGLPTYDSFWGGQDVYEVVSLSAWQWILDFNKENPLPRWESPGRLSPTEAFQFIEALPAPCEYVWKPSFAAARFVRAQLAYLHDQRYPVQSLLDYHRRRTQRNATEVAWCYRDPRWHWWEEGW